MGKALCEAFPYAADFFEQADAVLGYSLRKLCWDGPAEELIRTENTQPALLVCSLAALEVLKRERGLIPALGAGHSLGEYSALVAAQSLRFDEAVRLVHLRGRYMQEAASGLKGTDEGAMAAIVGLEADVLGSLCTQASDETAMCQPANENGAGQIVISGHRAAVLRAMDLARAAGARMVKLLEVSAPFHSRLMQPAAERLRAALLQINWHAPAFPIVANVDAEVYPQQATAVSERLYRQVAGTVKWEGCVQKLAAHGASSAIEVGPGKVLSGLIKRIAPAIATYQFAEPDDLAALPLG